MPNTVSPSPNSIIVLPLPLLNFALILLPIELASYVELLQPFLAGLNQNASPILAGAQTHLNMSNATSNSTIIPPPTSFSVPTDVSSLLAFLYTFSALRDWLKLALFGVALETCRRLYSYGYTRFWDQFFISASFESDDVVYDWMMFWLARLPQFRDVREFTVSTSSFGMDSDDEQDDNDDFDPQAAALRRRSRKVRCIPSYSATYSLWYKGRWMTISRVKDDQKWGWQDKATLHITMLARSRAALDKLIDEARTLYVNSRSDKIDIYAAGESYSNDWRLVASRPKRPISSIILDAGIKELVMDDAKDFMSSRKWYTSRGIPYRRGYLLYGPPGSGKTSIVHSLAGELMLDIYIISLSKSGMDDSTLNNLISDLPEHCIALMEDIDAAFTTSLHRGLNDPESNNSDPRNPNNADGPDGRDGNGPDGKGSGDGKNGTTAGSRITLSGLLNALDGVSAQEGRLLFATTNRYDVLDPALIRPGRMDLHVEFQLASRYQAQEIFRRFYIPDSEDVAEEGAEKKESVRDSGYATPSEKSSPKITPIAQLVDIAPSDNTSTPPTPSSSSLHPQYHGLRHSDRAPKLSKKQMERLAAEFASRVPERELAMASLQGYLMKYKIRPLQAVEDIEAWVEEKREAKRRKEGKNAEKVKGVSGFAKIESGLE